MWPTGGRPSRSVSAWRRARPSNTPTSSPSTRFSWFELAWLAEQERIQLAIPVLSWLQQLAEHVRTVGITPSVAATAVALPSSFPGDPADRLIYATAIEHGWRLVTKDRRLRSHRHPRPVTVW